MLAQAFGRRITHVSGAASSKPVGGMPKDLLLALGGNGDVSRRQLLQLFPWLRQLLHERGFSTDDLENEWSCLVLLLSFKPTIRVAGAIMATVDWLARLRRDPQAGLHVTATAQGSYSYHQATAAKDASWNHGRLLREPGALARALLAVVERGSRNRKYVRDYHKHKK
jgi:hypothetical protein